MSSTQSFQRVKVVACVPRRKRFIKALTRSCIRVNSTHELYACRKPRCVNFSISFFALPFIALYMFFKRRQ